MKIPSALCVLIAAVALPIFSHAHAVKRIYVSPRGQDDGSGSRWRPFATFDRAQQEVRRLREDPEATRIEALFSGGLYTLQAPIVIEPEDGGSERCAVIYRARDRQTPVFSGGRVLSGWTLRDDGAWTLRLPEVQSGAWDFAQLFVNGQRRFRPRVPREGFFTTREAFEPHEHGVKGFFFQPGDLNPAWANLTDIEFHVIHIWSASRLRAALIDTNQQVVHFTRTRPYNTSWSNFTNRRYWAENVKEAFGQPGEWYLDKPTGVLAYMPLPGETPANTLVEAPILSQLLIVQGRNGQPVINTTIEGLTFRLTNWTTPAEGNFTPQGEMNIPASTEIVRARGVTLRRCAFTHLGGYALAFGPGAHSNTVEHCLMRDMGAGGVKIGAPYVGYRYIESAADPLSSASSDLVDQSTSAIAIRDSRIVSGGRIHPAAHGVWIGHASHNRILHNEISDLYYTAVAIGWVWGYAEPSRAHHNEVAHNWMRQIGQGVLSDMGGVYTLGLSPGTTIHHNRIHDIHAFDYGGWGLYTDEGSSYIRMWNNLVYDVKTGGFHQHYGRDNILENNIFANSLTDQIQRTRNEEHISFHFRRNIVYWDTDGALLGMNWQGGARGEQDGKPTQRYELGPNIYWHRSGKEAIFPGNKTLAQWQAETGQDAGSLVTDPRFVNADANDFRLRPDSPAAQIGFQPFDLSAVGPRDPKLLPVADALPVPTPYPVRKP